MDKPLDEATEQFGWLMYKNNKGKMFRSTRQFILMMIKNHALTNDLCYSDYELEGESDYGSFNSETDIEDFAYDDIT